MFRPMVAVAAVLLFAAFSGQVQDTPSSVPGPAEVPPEAAKVVNPVKATPESHAKAKRIYGYDCAMCHGKEGRGDGDLAIQQKWTLTDLSKPETLKDKTDGELFWVLKHGKGNMPPEGSRGKEDDLWNLVLYVRSLSTGAHTPDLAPAVPQ